MSSLLIHANPACLEYENSRISLAIERISTLLHKHTANQNAFDYYSTMQECLLALDDAMEEMKTTRTAYENLLARICNMEMLIGYRDKPL